MNEDKFGRRASDQDLETRVAVVETSHDFIRDKVIQIESKLDGHMNDESGTMTRFTEAVVTNTEATKNLASNIHGVTHTMNQIADKLNIVGDKVALHDIKLSGFEVTGAVVWKIGSILAALMTAAWAVFTYFKG
jgi:predicted phage tail protein